MHLEVLVEDLSGKVILDSLLQKLLPPTGSSCRVIPYKGIGRIPKGLRDPKDARKRILLDNLPKLLRGYGQIIQSGVPWALVVVCDLDDRCLKAFRQELLEVLDSCDPRPPVCFCFAVEECEAWLLGDLGAVLSAYPYAKRHVLDRYQQDSICGTWELLADAVYRGGSAALSRNGFHAIGAEKSKWAKNVAPRITIDDNKSPSFHYFCRKIQELTTPGTTADAGVAS